MKRITILLALCVIAFTSCKKDPVWNRFFGYTKDDIVGHYEANPDESLYEDLPTEGVKVYSNAVLDITSLSNDLISIRIVIPGVINKVFSGPVYSAADNSDIVLLNGNEDIEMTVYKNEDGQIRLHGREKHYHYDANNVLVSSENYGFDVIKQE